MVTRLQSIRVLRPHPNPQRMKTNPARMTTAQKKGKSSFVLPSTNTTRTDASSSVPATKTSESIVPKPSIVPEATNTATAMKERDVVVLRDATPETIRPNMTKKLGA